MAVPRVAPPGVAGVALPQPLTPSEVQRIRRIFAHQAQADVPAAVAETAQLANPLLLGHILADRYLVASREVSGSVTPEQLLEWLASYAGLPDAPAVHKQLSALLPKGAALPAAPPPVRPVRPAAVATLADNVDQTTPLLKRNPVLDRSVHEPARAGQADRAVRLIARTPGLDAVYGALLRAEVAQILFSQGRDPEAFPLAEAAHRQARGEVGLAPYIAGLAAWRLGRLDRAAAMFEAAYRAPLLSSSQRAGAAFWAARAQLRRQGAAASTPWLERAAESNGSFYGLLARRALGLQPGAAALPEGTLGEADGEALADMPAGKRAFALLQVGQHSRAEAELRALWAETRGKPGLDRSILLVARAAGLNELASQVAAALRQHGVEAQLPAPRLKPAGGFRVDPALIYGMARVESNFDADAVSPAGARGLMQIMPTTAEFVLQESGRPENGRPENGRPENGRQDNGRPGRSPAQLNDPAVNLDLAQRYMLQIAQYDSIQSDLIRVLAGYNSGPSNVARWGGTIRHLDDPLLFIESVPIDETRIYIQRALAYTWLYAAKFRLPAPSLDELATGNWPRFAPQAMRKEVVRRDTARLH